MQIGTAGTSGFDFAQWQRRKEFVPELPPMPTKLANPMPISDVDQLSTCYPARDGVTLPNLEQPAYASQTFIRSLPGSDNAHSGCGAHLVPNLENRR